MKLTVEIVDELTMLSQFKLDSSLEGIKVHASASEDLVNATARLHDKGLISRSDGGYLTDLGRDAAEHLEVLHNILTTPVTVDTAS